MNEKHLNFLVSIGDYEQGYIGNNSLKWANYILPNVTFDVYLDRQFDRYELFEYCSDNTKSHLNVLVAILSWGGMRRDHGRSLLKNQDLVLELVENLRSGKYQTRKIAFSEFRNYRSLGLLPGLGIGYFTKLMCFLSPNLNCYIMDQWVAKSINLLKGQTIVNLTSNSWVNDNNSEEIYEEFCSHIDNLAIILQCSGFDAEKRIFSVGRKKGAWRNYLIQQYS